MTNTFRCLTVIWTLLLFAPLLPAQKISLIPQPELDPYGLKRVWFHQLQLHPPQGKILNVHLEGGQLFITTSNAALHVLDAETGEGQWSRTVGTKEFTARIQEKLEI